MTYGYHFWKILLIEYLFFINRIPFLKNQIKKKYINKGVILRSKGQPAYSFGCMGRVMIHHPTYTHLSALLSQRSYKWILSSFLCLKLNASSSLQRTNSGHFIYSRDCTQWYRIPTTGAGAWASTSISSHKKDRGQSFESRRAPYQIDPTAQWAVEERFSQVITQPRC